MELGYVTLWGVAFLIDSMIFTAIYIRYSVAVFAYLCTIAFAIDFFFKLYNYCCSNLEAAAQDSMEAGK